jgi:single-stranded-DNA-specific exonuclease
MKKINENPCAGIRSLIELSGRKKELQISDLVFMIGPRINAAGRIKHANQAVELLISDESKKLTDDKADDLNTTNTERQNFDRDITEEALFILKEKAENEERKSTVLFQPHWHKGVIGIVASRVIDHYYRPTIILCESNGKATGSARSVKGFNIYEAIKSCDDLLEQYGGHMYAAGLTMPLENVEAFIQRFEEAVASTIEEKSLTPEIEIDAEINFAEINDKFFAIIKQFAPFGPGNMRPVFLTKYVKDRGGSKIVGDNHLKLDISQRDHSASAIAFGMAHFAEHVLSKGKPAMPFDICYNIDENEWQGNKSLQLHIKDIKIS